MSQCVRQTAKRYKERPGPPFKAHDCKGHTKLGNDGKTYMSIANAKNVYQWKKTFKNKGRKYRTVDNGDRPYRVTVDSMSKSLSVEYLTYDDEDDYLEHPITATPVYNLKHFNRVWIGQGIDSYFPDKIDKDFIGNSIVAQKNNDCCVFIGSEVVEFNKVAGDSFDSAKLVSHVGANAVPYPYLIAATHTYFLLDFVAIPNELLDFKQGDLYSQFYGHTPHRGKGGLKKSAIQLQTKKIHHSRKLT